MKCLAFYIATKIEGLNVRIARMIDEARVVSAVPGVQYRVVVEHEQKCVMTCFTVVIATVGLVVGDPLPPVLVDLLALTNR